MKRMLAAAVCLLMLLAGGCDLFPVPSATGGAVGTVPIKISTATPSVGNSASAGETDAFGGETSGATVEPTEEPTATPEDEPTDEPTAEPTEEPNPTEGMIFPDSDTKLLTWAKLIALPASKLDLARNEIYARGGYKFTKEYYIDYYGKLSWYEENPDFSESKFTDIQRANVILIRAAEAALKGQLIEIKSGTKLDYDQDGKLETLTFSAPDTYHMNLKMKDGSTTASWNINCDTPSKKVYLGDIDRKDKLLDLFVDEAGPSDDYQVYAAGVKTNGFLKRDVVTGRIPELKLDGKGSIATKRRMDILMTWFCSVKYKLNASGKLAFAAQSSYSMGNFKVKTKVAIPLKKTASSSTDTAFTVPAGTQVQLVSTDNKKWIKIKAPAGTAWLEMATLTTLADPELPAFDAFDGLVLAD